MDQKTYWEGWNERHLHTEEPSESAKEFSEMLPAGSKVLELGCGPGEDAAFLAQRHVVTATDFSESAIVQNKRKFGGVANLEFRLHDTAQPLPFEQEAFGGVYARLSLHYFTDEVTQNIFTEIHRILTPKGLLYFVCKSTSDKFFGKGKQIDRNTFVDDNGHLRHFFTPEFTKHNLDGLFDIEKLEQTSKIVYGSESDVIICAAKKTLR